MLAITFRSSNLRSASYEVWSATLTIEFRSGSEYSYFDVPPNIYDGLAVAESPGRFHHTRITHQFRYQKLK